MTENQNNTNQHVQYPYPTYPYFYPTNSPAYYPVNYGRDHKQATQQQQTETRQVMPPQMQQTQTQQQTPQQNVQLTQQGINVSGMLPIQQSFIENILRLNKGKRAKVYMTFEGNTEWNAKVFDGIIEAAGRDHIILSEEGTGRRVLLLMVYLDYVEFQEEINYTYPAFRR